MSDPVPYSPPCILAADGAPGDRQLLVQWLKRWGYQVLEADSAAAALAHLDRCLPDLILVDAALPDRDGYWFCQQVRSLPSGHTIPVLFVGDCSASGAKVRAFHAGGSDFIAKPLPPEELRARVENQLAMRSLRCTLEAQNQQLQQQIRERDLLEARVRGSEEKLRAIFTAMTDAVLMVEVQDGQIASADLLPTRATQIDTFCERALPALLESLWDPEAPAAWTEKIQRTVDLQDTLRFDYCLIADDGEPVWLAIAISPFNATAALLVARDIGDRKLAEAARQEAEARYHSIVENALEGIYQTTPDGRYISANPALARMYGYESAAALIESVQDIGREVYVDPNRRREFVVALQGRDSIAGFESLVYTCDGRPIWISENARAVRDDGGTLLYYEGMITDITDKKLAQQALQVQKRRIEELLLNVLPQPIAVRLQAGESPIVDRFAEASVLFIDLVGFTEFAARRSPAQLVNTLNQIFSAFDRLVEQAGLEKIKTIGDAYMVVGGLPVPQPDHLGAIARLALAMQTTLADLRAQEDFDLHARIGIHSGPVVAGIIGISKFGYDLWGDAVNVASRMESSGLPDRIQTTDRVRDRLADRFQFEARGRVVVKGKGEMTTYWLLGEGPTEATAELGDVALSASGSEAIGEGCG